MGDRVVIGRYEVERRLGHGSFATVWLARDPDLDAQVAIKVLGDRWSEDAGSRAAFVGEARLMRRLEADQIVRVHSVEYLADGRPFFVMEYADQGSLRNRLVAEGGHQEHFSLDEALAISEQIALALVVAHHNGVVHRDLKPANVLFRSRPEHQLVRGIEPPLIRDRLVVADFGIARIQADRSQGQAFGTPGYMAPEQAQGAFSTRSDVYSAAIILFELITGRLPQSRPVLADAAVLETLLLSVTKPESARHLARMLVAALAVDPAHRIPSAQAWLASLRSMQASVEEVAIPTGELEAPPIQSPGTTPKNRDVQFNTAVSQAVASRRIRNLPSPTTRLIGREDELTALVSALRQSRLVSITGTGGVGKTRLAIEVAHDAIEDFDEGWFVDLSSVRDPALVPARIASSIRIPVYMAPNPVGVIAEVIGTQIGLLVLDNFEQVIEAAPVATGLLGACPNLKILVTSRERLRVSGEHRYPIGPLPDPDETDHLDRDMLSRFGGTALFIERAMAVEPDLDLSPDAARAIASLCRALDGLPLAIELAAARSVMFPPQELLNRLGHLGEDQVDRDRPIRQRSLTQTIAWSYELLSPDERTVFEEMSVFRGGASIEAVESVLEEQVEEPLSVLEGLVYKSLVTAGQTNGEPRFAMLETIRDYAADRLREKQQASDIRERHAQVYATLTEQADLHLWTDGALGWYRRLNGEYENLTAALQWSFIQGGDPATGCRIIGSSYFFWFLDHPAGLLRWSEQAMRHVESLPTALRARVLLIAAHASFAAGDLDEVRLRSSRAADSFRAVGDPVYEAMATVFGAVGAIDSPGMIQGAIEAVRRALATVRSFELPGLEIISHNAIGELTRTQGDVDAAEGAYEEALELARSVGHKRHESVMLMNLADLAGEQGAVIKSGQLATEALEIALGLQQPMLIAWALSSLAQPVELLGEHRAAAYLLGASDRALATLGVPRQQTDQQVVNQVLASVRQQLDDDHLGRLLNEGAQMSLADAADLAIRTIRTSGTRFE